MTKKLSIWMALFCVIPVVLLFTGCESSDLTAPNEADVGSVDLQRSVPEWISWTPEAMKKINEINKIGDQAKFIQSHVGGTIGGHITFNNSVIIPAGALAEDTWISVSLGCLDDKDICGAEVDFYPNGNFLIDVEVKLSWEAIGFDGNPDELNIYYFNEEEEAWLLVENPTIDFENQTISVFTDHFTRYGWAL